MPRRFPHTRAELQAATPGTYRLWKHVGGIAAFVAAGIALAAWGIRDAGWGDVLFFFAVLLLANFGEWAAHRTTLHHPVFPRAVFRRHVLEHHAFFSYESMTVDELRDVKWVLFPPWALPLLVATMAPVLALAWALGPPNAPWTVLLATIVYYGVYEVFHALAHLPETFPFAGNRIVRRVTHHHRVHHDPKLMQRWNFNFAVPIFDWLFGTLYRSDRVSPIAKTQESSGA